MDSFYIVVLSVATVILILLLTFVGILLKKAKTADIFPPVTNMCPDYWDASSTPGICYVPDGDKQKVNRGSISYQSSPNQYKIADTDRTSRLGYTAGTGTGTGTNSSTMNMLADASWAAVYPGYTLKCAQRKWALDNGISWDGISNYNGCVDPTSK